MSLVKTAVASPSEESGSKESRMYFKSATWLKQEIPELSIKDSRFRSKLEWHRITLKALQQRSTKSWKRLLGS